MPLPYNKINNPPLYSVGETVFLRASAERGFLESYRIDEIRHSGNGYIYFLLINPRRFNDELPTIGDRNSLRQTKGLKFRESELITICEALALKRVFHENKLADTVAELSRLCDEESGSGSG